MLRRIFAILIFPAFALSLAATPNTPSAPKLSANEVVDKNVAARGGLPAWRAVQSMMLTGKLGVGGNQRATLSVPIPRALKESGDSVQGLRQRPVDEMQLPFVLKLKRPEKMRLELEFKGQTAVQTFDGTHGWKLRPFLNRPDAEPYSQEEMKIASRQAGAELDGYLIDYAAKGTAINVDGTERVEGRDTYKLKLTLKGGDVIHVWVDAETFLEAKVEGQPRRLDGVYHPVEVYYRDYRPVNGLQIPFVLETRVLPVTKTATGLRDTPVPPEKIIIDTVAVNPKLEDSQFSKPVMAAASKGK